MSIVKKVSVVIFSKCVEGRCATMAFLQLSMLTALFLSCTDNTCLNDKMHCDSCVYVVFQTKHFSELK